MSNEEREEIYVDEFIFNDVLNLALSGLTALESPDGTWFDYESQLDMVKTNEDIS